MRGDWLKIWRASQPNSTPRSWALTSPPAVETCPPISTAPQYNRRFLLSPCEFARDDAERCSTFASAVPIRGLQGCTPLPDPPQTHFETSTEARHGWRAAARPRARDPAERGTWTSPHRRVRGTRAVPGPRRVAQSRAQARARGAHLGRRRRGRDRV